MTLLFGKCIYPAYAPVHSNASAPSLQRPAISAIKVCTRNVHAHHSTRQNVLLLKLYSRGSSIHNPTLRNYQLTTFHVITQYNYSAQKIRFRCPWPISCLQKVFAGQAHEARGLSSPRGYETSAETLPISDPDKRKTDYTSVGGD